ncbi:type II toxin-antitoxin system RelE/ParE family toxin [Listeria grandensis]|uniref:type II toxin-antitoxin system RelE/ParE family toxin n=1 Tax=Listeria grandensis TaxID=1494963 RepID=UPI00098CFFAE
MTETVKIRFSKHASLDYDRISLYLVEDLCQFQAAQKFSEGIELLLLNLASFPMLGKLYDNGKLISKPYRRASFDRYTVFLSLSRRSTIDRGLSNSIGSGGSLDFD